MCKAGKWVAVEGCRQILLENRAHSEPAVLGYDYNCEAHSLDGKVEPLEHCFRLDLAGLLIEMRSVASMDDGNTRASEARLMGRRRVLSGDAMG